MVFIPFSGHTTMKNYKMVIHYSILSFLVIQLSLIFRCFHFYVSLGDKKMIKLNSWMTKKEIY